MAVYTYVTGNGTITSKEGDFTWRSLCHNEGIMDKHHIFEEAKYPWGFGWSVCRRCGTPSSFGKQWVDKH